MGPADEAEGVGSEWGGFLETPNNNQPGPLPPELSPDDRSTPTPEREEMRITVAPADVHVRSV